MRVTLTLSKLEHLLERMLNHKAILEWGLEHCDDCERQNIVWMDCNQRYEIEELREIIKFVRSMRI